MPPYTRAAFDRQRATRSRVERGEGLTLALVSVGLGLAQLAMIRWLDARLDRDRAVAIEGAVFLGYMARAVCPACRAALRGHSDRVAAATGRCDSCGGQVLENNP